MKKILPQYTYFPLIITVILNFAVFYGTRPFNRGLHHYNMSLPIDDWIPFVPAAIVIYFLAFLTWVIGYCVIARESEEICCELLAAEVIAKLLSMVCFLVIPTVMVRPEVTGNDPFSWLTAFAYAADTPDNLFPSIHCLANWFAFRGALRCRKVGSGYKIFMGVYAVLVFAATLLVKQHVFVDVLGGVAVVELGLWLSRCLGAGRLFGAANRRLGLSESRGNERK